MHELALSESMMQIIREQAALQSFSRVKTVRLEIGALSCVEPQALRFCFDTVKKGTLADAAALDIIMRPGRAWCWDCGETVLLGTRGEPCPSCAGFRLEVNGGDEMRIKELEVE